MIVIIFLLNFFIIFIIDIQKKKKKAFTRPNKRVLKDTINKFSLTFRFKTSTFLLYIFLTRRHPSSNSFIKPSKLSVVHFLPRLATWMVYALTHSIQRGVTSLDKPPRPEKHNIIYLWQKYNLI